MTELSIPTVCPSNISEPWLVAFTTLAQDDAGRKFDYKADAKTADRDALQAALHPLSLTWLTLEHGANNTLVPGLSVLSPSSGDSNGLKTTHSDPVPVCCSQPTADAAIVVEEGYAAALTTADCLPVIIVDRESRSVAVAHAGWRGVAQGVIGGTLGRMAGLAGRSSPQIQDFQAWIGPSIKQADFEVGAEVRDELLRATAVTPEMFVAARDGKYLADLQAMAVAQLVDAGVPLQAIEVYPVSTMQDPRLHSARRDKERSGRMATVVGICES